MIKELVLEDKKAKSAISALYEGWCLHFGCPSVGFYAYYAEFENYKLEEFAGLSF